MSEAEPLSTIFQQFSDDAIDGAAADDDNAERFTRLADISLTEEELERYFNQVFQENFTVAEVKKYMERKMLQIEGPFLHRFDDIRDRFNFALSDEDTNTLGIIESSIVQIYRVICCVLYDNGPLSIKLPSEVASAGYMTYTPSGVMVPVRVNAHQKISTPQKALFYAFILLHYYGAMIAHIESAVPHTNMGDLRYVYYLHKMTFSKNEQQLSNSNFLRSMAKIFSLAKIMPNSLLLSNIDREIRCEVRGDLEITNHTTGYNFSFLQHSSFDKYNIIELGSRFGLGIKQVLIFESNAIFGRCANALRDKIYVLKTTLVIVLRGKPDLFTLIFLADLFKKKTMAGYIICDGDLDGFAICNRVKFGTTSQYAYLNAKLSIPHAIHLGIHSFEALLPYAAFTNLNDAKIQELCTRLTNVGDLNTHNQIDAFDNKRELIENLLSMLIIGRSQPGSSISAERLMVHLNHFEQNFTLQQLTLTASSGLDFFVFQSELVALWEGKYGPLSMDHAQKFVRYSTPTVYVDRFVRILNAQQTQFVMKCLIFNSRLNRSYVCHLTDDIQLIQITVEHFLVIHVQSNIANVYGVATNTEFRSFKLDLLQHRYASVNRIEYKPIDNIRFPVMLSGVLCCRLALALATNENVEQVIANSFNTNNLVTWFQQFIGI